MNNPYPKYRFTETEQQALRAVLEHVPDGGNSLTSHGNWVAFYKKLSELLGQHIEAGTPQGQDLQDFKNVKLWTDVAISANAGVGLHSTFIRTFTDYQGFLRLGRHFTAEEMQQASNGVAFNFYQSLFGLKSIEDYAPWTVPTIAQLAQDDASSIGKNLYKGHLPGSDDAIEFNSAWSGTLGFNLLGGKDPFETWRLLAEPARDGVAAAALQENQKVDSLDDFKNILFATSAYAQAWKASMAEGLAVGLYELARLIAYARTRIIFPSHDEYLESIKAQININISSGDWLGLVKHVANFSPTIAPAVGLIADIGSAHFLDMLRGVYQGKPLLGQTDKDGFQQAAHDFFKTMTPAKIESIGARMLSLDTAQLVQQAQHDIDVRNALQSLSAISVDVSSLNLPSDVLQNLQIFDAQTGSGSITSEWITDRADFLNALIKKYSFNGIYLDERSTDFFDIASGEKVESGVNTLRQVIFGSSEDDQNLLGHWLVDRIYGGAGNDRLDGRGGNDYLEGGSGHDVYVLSASNKGIATVFDTDGQGALQVGHDVLASLSFARADLPVNDGHQAQVFYSTNPEARATYRLSSMPDGQWEFAALLDGAYQPLAHLMHWQNGQLGLQVDFDQRPGLLPQDLRFALDHRNSSLFHNYVGNHAPEGIAVHGGPRSAQFSGSAHGDVIFTGDSLTNLVYAQGGSDYVRGGSGREFILAGMNRADLTGDDDVVYGAGDSDIIYGGGGNDTLWGGDGSLAYLQPLGPAEMANERTRRGDWISAQAGSDWVFGSSAEDVLFGGGGADHVHGGAGDDLILGDADYAVSSSSMPIGGANDGIVAYRWMPDGSIRRLRDGPDAALAIPRGNVFEWQWSQSEQDFTLTPWRNFIREDRVAEKGGDDKLYGGEGNDWIAGQTGDDYLEGGDGDDVLWGDDSQPLPDGGDGNDTLVAGKGQDRLFGGKGDDTLDAREEDGELDKLKGGEGDDTLMGGTGEDVLYGEDGNDVLIAGAETARMEGGDGNDTYISSTGDDVMFDRDGDDDYRLSRGNDAVTDLKGHDVYRIGFGHLAMGGTTVVQDLDGKGEIYYGAGLLSGQGVYAKSEGQWLSLDGQVLLSRSGGDLHISNATAGAQSGKVVFTNFFSQDVFLSLELPKYVPPAAPAPVNQAPVAGPALPAQQAQEDAPWSFALPADAFSDPEGQALTYSAARKGGGALPAWLHFDAASGVFSGTPGNDDVSTVVVRVAARDPQGAQAWQEWALEVLNTNDAPEAGAVLTPVAVPAGQALSLVLPAGAFVDVDKGDVLSYSATLGDGSPLPGWLRMDSATGALSGMAPHTSLDTLHALRIVATDQAGEQASQSLLLTVQASGEPVLPGIVPMVGTPGDDTISGTTGNDILSGLEGNDTLYGGAGKDQLFGDGGDDALHGDTGDDQLYGGHGNDELRGWADDDVLNGQDGDDQLYGGDGDDVLFGEAGRDVLHGDAGADTLYGGEGDDELRGWVGDDTLHGDGGADRLYGGQGRDALYGWEGDDLLHGDADDDWLYGGAGADALYGDAGDDQLYGDGGDDLLVGGAGRDVLAGGAGHNQLFGGLDGDLYVIEAGAGSHLIVEEGFAGVDIVQLRALASQDAYTIARVGDDLHLRYGAPGSEQTLMVRGQFAVQAALEEFHFSDGVILSASDIAQAAGVSKSAWAVNSANSDATWANAAEIALMGLHARELEWGLA